MSVDIKKIKEKTKKNGEDFYIAIHQKEDKKQMFWIPSLKNADDVKESSLLECRLQNWLREDIINRVVKKVEDENNKLNQGIRATTIKREGMMDIIDKVETKKSNKEYPGKRKAENPKI